MSRAISIIFVCCLTLSWRSVFGADLLITNAIVFNGIDDKTIAGHVLVSDGLIKSIYKEMPSDLGSAKVIDAGGRFLSPGFIDIHAHINEQSPFKYFKEHPIVTGIHAGKMLEFYLQNGFTSIRGAGGTHPILSKAINAGDVRGPSLYLSGAYISQTSGHGDYRESYAPNPIITGHSPYIDNGMSILADGPNQVLTATRENLKMGATQIKIMGGGGILSEYGSLHTLQYTDEEIQAAVKAASDWGTYVMAHAYTSKSIQRLVRNGVKSIEHGVLMDEQTAKMVAQNKVVMSTQIFIFSNEEVISDEASPVMIAKNNYVKKGLSRQIELLKKYKIKTGFGTDFLGDYHNMGREFMLRAQYWTPFEVLKQATSESASIIRMAGPLIEGPKFGEIKEGWSADLILIDGNPLENFNLLSKPEDNIVLVIKQGEIMIDKLVD